MRSRGAGLLVLLCPELFLHTHDQRTDVAALQFPSSITTRLRANRIVGRRTASPAAGSSSSSSAASSSSPRGGRSKSSASPSADRVRLLRDARILLMPPLGGKAVVESGLADAIVQSSSSGVSASAGGASAGAGASASSAMLSGQGMQHSVLESARLVLGYVWVLLQSVAPTPFELQIFLRLIVAAMVGMFIGTERRTSHRPAGVRTMSLVALGACTFTLVSQLGFVGKADQARVAASVASGVGFIGAGVITTSGKEASSMRESLNTRGRGGSNFPGTTVSMNDVDGEVKGLTTASAIWITAGLGMACGAGLLFIAMLGAGLTVGILKISEVTTTVQKKWARVRSVLRPKLAQKLADEANAERTGSTPEHNHEDHDDDEEDDVDHEQEMARKEQQERQEKEKKEKQEINDKTEKEKEHYRLKLLEVEQENEKLKAQKKVDGRVAEEAGSPVQSGKPGREEADSGEHRGPSPGKEPQDVEYGFDPFYGRPWGTEIPKVRPDVGDASETPPVSGPTRRRPLSRSRVLASRKKRRNQYRGSGPDFPVDSAPNSLSLDDAREALSTPPASLGPRAAEDPRVSRSAATVGDMVMKEKEMEKQQQMKKPGRGSDAAKEGESGGDLGGSVVADTRGGGGVKTPAAAEEHLRPAESAAAASLPEAKDAAAAVDEEVVPAAEGTGKGQGDTEAAGISLMHGLVGVSVMAAVADGGKTGNVVAVGEGGKRPLDEVPVAMTDVSGEVEAFEYVDHGQSVANANEDEGKSSSNEGEIGSGSAAAEPDLEYAAASSAVAGDAASGSSVDESTDDSGAPGVEDDVPAETVVAVETQGEDPDHRLPAVDEAGSSESSSDQPGIGPGDVETEAEAEEGVADSASDGEQTRGSSGMSTAAGAGAETTSLETADARADPSADGADVEEDDEDGKRVLAKEHDVDMVGKDISDASGGGSNGSGNGAESKPDTRGDVSTPQPESTAKAETDSSASDAGRGRDRWWGGRVSSTVVPASEASVGERSSAKPDDGSATEENDSQMDLAAGATETDGTHSSSVRGGMDSFPWLKPTKGDPGDGSRASRKDYTRGGKPKWRKGSGRGGVDGSEAKKAGDSSGGDLASSVTVEPQEAEELVVPSASEEPVPEAETAAVVDFPAMVDNTPAIDEEVVSPGQEKTVEQGETGGAGGSSVDGSTDESGVPDVVDDTPAEAAVASESEAEDADPRLPTADQAGAADSRPRQLESSSGDRAKEAAAKEDKDIAGISLDGEETAGGSGISTSADASTEPMLLETADARADYRADAVDVEEDDEDGKGALAKKEENINDDVDMVGKDISDGSASCGGGSSSGNGAESITDTQGDVSAPQPESTAKAETDSSASDAGRGRDRWWGGRVSSTVARASEVSFEERSSAKPDDGNVTEENDSQMDLAAGATETDGTHSSSVRGGMDSFPWLKPTKGDPGDGSRASRKDYTRGGKPKWRKGSGRGGVDGSKAKKAGDSGDDVASSVTVEPQEAEELVVPSASEEPVPEAETAAVVDFPAMMDAVSPIDEEVVSPGQEKTVGQGEREGAGGSSVDGSTDESGVPDVVDDAPAEAAVASESEAEDADPRLPVADQAGSADSRPRQLESSSGDRAKEAAAKEEKDIGGISLDGEETTGGSGISTSADASTEPMLLETADARADPSAHGADVEEGDEDGKGALAKEESINDDTHMAGKDTSDGSASCGGGSGSGSSSRNPEAKKEAENDGDMESSIAADTKGAEGLVEGSAEVSVPMVESAAVLDVPVTVDAAAAVDVEVAPAGEKKTVGQGGTEAAGEVAMDGVVDVSGAAAEADGQSMTDPKANLEDMAALSSGTADVVARDSSVDGLPDGSEAVDDESLAEASVAVNAGGADTDHALTDQADVEVGSSSERFPQGFTAEKGVTESSSEGEQDTDSGGMSTTASASGTTPSFEIADARAKPGADDTDGEGGLDDGKGALAKEKDSIQDDVDAEDKPTSDTSGGDDDGSGNGVESQTNTQGGVSTSQPPSTTKAEIGNSASGAGRDHGRWWGGRVPNTAAPASGVSVRERASAEPDDGPVTEEQDRQGDSAKSVAATDGSDSNSDRGVDSFPWLKPTKEDPGDGPRILRKDYTRGGKPKWGTGHGRGDLDGSEAEEEGGGDLASSVVADTQGTKELVVPSVSEEPVPEVETAAVVDLPATVDGVSAIDEQVMSAGKEKTVGQGETEAAGGLSVDGSTDESGVPDVVDDAPVEAAVASESEAEDANPRLPVADQAGATDSRPAQLGRTSGDRAKEAAAKEDKDIAGISLDGEETAGSSDMPTSADASTETASLDTEDARTTHRGADDGDGEDGDEVCKGALPKEEESIQEDGDTADKATIDGRGSGGGGGGSGFGSSEATKPEESGGDVESSVATDTQGDEGLVLQSASAEPVSTVGGAAVVLDATGADNEKAVPAAEKMVGQGTGDSSMGGVADISGVGGLGDDGAVSVGANSDGVTTTDPKTDLEDDEVSQSATADGAAVESSADEMIIGLGAPDAGDGNQAEAAVAEDSSSGEDSDDVPTAGDQANVEVGSSSEQLSSSPGDRAKEAIAEERVTETSSDGEDARGKGMMSTASGVETTSLESADARARPDADDADGDVGHDDGKGALGKEENSIQGDVDAAEKATSGGNDSGSDNGTKPKTDVRGEVSTPQPESTAKAATDTYTSDAGHSGGRWWGGRVSDTVAPASEVSVGERASAEPDDGCPTEEQDDQVDLAPGVAEADGADSNSVRDVDSFAWLKPTKGAPGDGSRTSRKDYTTNGNPKWRKGSGRGDVGGSDAKKAEDDGDLESSVTADTQGAEELVVPSASEEPLPTVQKATVAVAGTAAVDEAVASPGEKMTGGQGEREAPGVSLMGEVVDISGVGGLGEVGAVSVDGRSDGVTTAGPEADLEDDESSSSATADVAAGYSSVDGFMGDSGVPGAADDNLAEAVGTVDSPSEDSDDALMAGDEANVEVGSSLEQLPSGPGDTSKEAIAEEGVAAFSSDKENATGSGIMSTASGAGMETTSLEPADARVKPSTSDTDSEEGDDDRKDAPTKGQESMKDDVDTADKDTSDTSGGDDSGSGKRVSEPQLESTSKAETDSSEAGHGRRPWWRGRVSKSVTPASEVDVGERASAEPDGGRPTEEQDREVDLAPGVAAADGANSSSVRQGVDVVPWWKAAKSALGDGWKDSRKDPPSSGKPRWRKGGGRGDVGGSEGKMEERGSDLESSAAGERQGAEGLLVPSASEEPVRKAEKDTVDGTVAVGEAVASPEEEKTDGQMETEAMGVSLMGGAVDMSGLGGLGEVGAISVGRSADGVTTVGPEANLKNDTGSSSAAADGAAGDSSVDGLKSGSEAPGAGDDSQAEAVVAVDSPGEASDDALTAGDEANVEIDSSSKQLSSSPRDRAKEAAAEERVAESCSEKEEATGSGMMSTASGAGVETTSVETVDARAKPTADDKDGKEGHENGKGPEESIQDDVNAADKPTSATSGGGGSGSHNGAAESKTDVRGEVSTPQPESMADAATDASVADAGRGGDRWWGGRVSDTDTPTSVVSVGERSSAEPDDGSTTEEQDSHVDTAAGEAEANGADSSSVRGGMDSFPWLKPAKGAPDDRSRESRKDYARSSMPKGRKGSGRGDVGDSEATTTGERGGGLESSVTADTQGAEGLAVPSVAEEPVPKAEKATVAVDDTAAVGEAVASPGEEKTGGQMETEAAEVSLMGGAVDMSGLGGSGDGGAVCVGRSSDGVTTVGPEANIKNDNKGSSSAAADGDAGDSSVDRLKSGSGAPDAGDDSQAEAVVAVDSPGEASDDAFTAGDEANVETGSSSKQLLSSPRDRAKEAAAEERVAESCLEKEEATGSGMMSTASGAGAETTSVETVDARAKPTAEAKYGDVGNGDGKGAAESTQDDVDAADKSASATSGGGSSGSDIVAAESKTDTRGEASTPQPESTTKAATDASASDAGRGRDRWWGGHVPNAAVPASDVSVGERSSAKPDDGRASEENDSQVESAAGAAETDEASSSRVRGGVDSVPRWTPAKDTPGDVSRVSRKDFTKSGKPKWLRGSGRGDVDGSETTKAEESGGGSESSVAPDAQGAEGLAVPSASEEPLPKAEKATVAVDGTAAVDEEVASVVEETAVAQNESKKEEGCLKDGVADVSGVGSIGDVGAVAVDGSSDDVTPAGPEADLKADESSSSAIPDVATGDSPVDGLVGVSGALGAGDGRPAEDAVAVGSLGEDSDDALTAADKPDGKIGSSSERFSSSPGERANEATAGDGVTESSLDGEEATGNDISTAASASAETTPLETTDARAKPSADDTDGKEGDKNGKRALAKDEESIQDDIGMADKPTGGGDDSSSGNGAAESKTDTEGEVSTPQPASTTKTATDASSSDTGRDRGRWWGGRVADTVAPTSEVSVGELASAEPDDDRVTEEQNSQVDPAEPVVETDGANSNNVRSGVESVPRWTPAKDSPGDVSRTSRKDYTKSGKPKWQKSSVRGDVDGAEAKKAEGSGGGLESSVMADTHGAEGLVVPSASEEPVPEAAVVVDDAGAVDEVASVGEETAMGQDESKTAEGSLVHGAADVSEVGAAGVGGAASADVNSDVVTKADPEVDLEDDEASSSATADGAAGDSSQDGLIDDSGARRGDDDRPVEGVVAADTQGGDTCEGSTASDEADAEVGSLSELLVSSPRNTAEVDTAKEGATESASDGEQATGSDDISTAVDSSVEITSLETADARAKPSADDTDGEDGDDDGKGSLAKGEESTQDDVDTADKATSDTSGGGASGSKNGTEPKADMRGEVSTPQPESTAKAEAAGGRGRWWGGRVPDTAAQASDVGARERSSVKPEDGPVTEELDSQVTSAEKVAEEDGADSDNLRGGVDSVPRWMSAKGATGDDSKASRKDYTRSGKPKWSKGSGRGDVESSGAKKEEESGGNLQSSVTADTQGTEELVVPSASEEPVPKVDENAGDDASPALSATTPALSGVGAVANDSTVGTAESPEAAISPASQPQRLTSSPGTTAKEPADSENGSLGSGGTQGKEGNGAKEAVEEKGSVGEGDAVAVFERAAAAAETDSVGSSEGGAADAAIKGAGISVGPSSGDFPHETVTGPESDGAVTGAADGAANGAVIVSDDDAKRARVKAKLGVAKLEQGEAEKAVSLFEQAASIDPGWWEVFYYAALAHDTLGNTEAAAHALVSALGIPAQTEDAEVAKLASLASQVLAALEDDEQHGSTAEILKTAMDSSGLMFAGTSSVRGKGGAGVGEDARVGGALLEEEKKADLCDDLCDKIWEVIREVTAPLDAPAVVDAPSVDDARVAEQTEDEGRDATGAPATSGSVDPDGDASAVADEDEAGGGAEDPTSQPRRSTRTWAKGSGWAKGKGWTKKARSVGGARDSRT